ncbi:MAG TPA: GNAT family N-acetyltransferase [Burkholderiales bacterium]|nr:GNAT family N-acetyltransferase [Burkholderiales bacterium]
MTHPAAIPVKRLSGADRPALVSHFLQFDEEDRRLRFGSARGDDSLREYVESLDFDRDAVFGVFDDELALAGVAHVAVSPDSAELGVSVLPGARKRGIGTALFERANLFARTHYIRTMFTHCLTENRSMMRLARKAGMVIVTEAGEADARLELRPAGMTTITREMMADRVALLDYAMKAQLTASRRLAASLRGEPRED